MKGKSNNLLRLVQEPFYQWFLPALIKDLHLSKCIVAFRVCGTAGWAWISFVILHVALANNIPSFRVKLFLCDHWKGSKTDIPLFFPHCWVVQLRKIAPIATLERKGLLFIAWESWLYWAAPPGMAQRAWVIAQAVMSTLQTTKRALSSFWKST